MDTGAKQPERIQAERKPAALRQQFSSRTRACKKLPESAQSGHQEKPRILVRVIGRASFQPSTELKFVEHSVDYRKDDVYQEHSRSDNQHLKRKVEFFNEPLR